MLLLVLLYRRSHSVLPLVNRPSPNARRGPVGELVDTLGEAAYAHAIAGDAVTSQGPTTKVIAEGRLRALILYKLGKRLGEDPAEIAARAAQGKLPRVHPDVVGFLKGESSDKRWRRRALERYKGSRFLFPFWFQFNFKRALPPPEAYLRDLTIVLQKLEESEAANARGSPSAGEAAGRPSPTPVPARPRP